MSSPRTVRLLLRAVVAALALLAAPGAAAAATGGSLAPTPLYGGMQMVSDIDSHCVSGFNVTDRDAYYVLTAGPCLEGTTGWSVGGGYLGPSGASGGTAGLVRVADLTRWEPRPEVLMGGQPSPVTGYRAPSVGMRVCTSNATMGGVSCGVVTALNVTVQYPEGTYFGLAATNICLNPGDADTGGPVVSEGAAVGVVFGSGGCTTYVQPLGPVLAAYNLILV